MVMNFKGKNIFCHQQKNAALTALKFFWRSWSLQYFRLLLIRNDKATKNGLPYDSIVD